MGGAHRDPAAAAHALESFISKSLRELKKLKTDDLLDRRYDKFRAMGQFAEASSAVSVSRAG